MYPTLNNLNWTATRNALVLSTLTVLLLIVPYSAHGQININPESSFEEQLVAASQQQSKIDPVQTVLKLLLGPANSFTVAEAMTRIKASWPQYEAGTPIRVLPEIRANLVGEGAEYDRLQRAGKALLRSCGLDGRVRLLLFKSEIPIAVFNYPNALSVSTRAMAILNDEELQALCSHELMHMVAHSLFSRAADKHDKSTLRLLELFYDAGGSVIIANRGGDPRLVMVALNKINSVLEVEFQEFQSGLSHPPLKLRSQLNAALYEQIRNPVVATAAGH